MAAFHVLCANRAPGCSSVVSQPFGGHEPLTWPWLSSGGSAVLFGPASPLQLQPSAVPHSAAARSACSIQDGWTLRSLPAQCTRGSGKEGSPIPHSSLENTKNTKKSQAGGEETAPLQCLKQMGLNLS